jgi:YegS/Rv2252/BmrU family lipid kinase
VRVLIFANPIAGSGRGRAIANRLQSRLSRRKIDVRVFLERPTELDASEFTLEPIYAAITIGGDGTLRGVADFLLQTVGPEKFPPLVVVPLGTANLMRQHLNLDWDAADIDRVIDEHRVVHLDAARANGELFLLMAGIGIDAAIVHELDRIRSGPISKLSYLLPTAMALKDYTFPSMSVELDGKLVFKNAPALTFVGNVAEYGTGFPILPDAQSADGLLDVCVLPCKNIQKLAELALRTVVNEHKQMPGVVYARGRQIRVHTDNPVPVQLDGDPGGHTPLTIELLQHRLPFIVP